MRSEGRVLLDGIKALNKGLKEEYIASQPFSLVKTQHPLSVEDVAGASPLGNREAKSFPDTEPTRASVLDFSDSRTVRETKFLFFINCSVRYFVLAAVM